MQGAFKPYNETKDRQILGFLEFYRASKYVQLFVILQLYFRGLIKSLINFK